MVKLLSAGLLLNLIAQAITAQHITGRVQDEQTAAPMPFANVYVNNTTLGTVSNERGEFTLKLSEGHYDVIVSFVGYHARRFDVWLGAGDLDLGKIDLVPNESELAPITVQASRDKNWERNLARFKRTFLGTGKEARKCTIKNPWVLEFREDQPMGTLSAVSVAPLEIENQWLGYSLFYDLARFAVVDHLPYRAGEARFSFTGFVRFQELESSAEKERLAWKANREKAYRNSFMYFFRSIAERTMEAHGFRALEDNREKSKPPSEVHEDWFSPSRPSAHRASSLAEQARYQLIVPKWIEVHRRDKGLFTSNSQLHAVGDTVFVNAAGFPLNPEEIEVTGDWYSSRIQRLLPTNYAEPEAVTTGKPAVTRTVRMPLQDVTWFERLHVQTDKPYYYAGESMWFKGYVQYSSPSIRDSLSRVAYVDLVNPKKEVIMSRIVEIDSGTFHNDFALPDSLATGTYYLRAYTNLSLNFGASGQFIKPLQLLALTDRIDPSQEVTAAPSDSSIIITPDQNRYAPHEKIVLKVFITDESGNPVSARLGISVTDARQVVPVAERTIVDSMNQSDSVDVTRLQLQYPVERGLRYVGTYLNAKGLVDSTGLDLLQWNPPMLTNLSTNAKGEFRLQGYSFYDTAIVSVKSTRYKGGRLGRFVIHQRQSPPLPPILPRPLSILQTTLPQRVMNKNQSTEGRMLEEVEVKAKRIMPLNRLTARADFVLQGKDLGPVSRDLAVALQAKVPGLRIQFGGTKKEYRPNGIEIEYTEPVYTYFDSPIFLGNSLVSGDEIESILFFKRMAGRPASMMIIPKPGWKPPVDPDFQALKLKGFDTPRVFKSPSYDSISGNNSTIDYRSTIYWNPDVTTDAGSGMATISFWSADLPTTYRIVVEGITQNGVTVRKVAFIEIGND